MANFRWKRKIPSNRASTRPQLFNDTNHEEEDDVGEDFDWVAVAKRKKLIALEDNKALVSRLKEEGILLAESGKFWQAINHWDRALSLDASGSCEIFFSALNQVPQTPPCLR